MIEKIEFRIQIFNTRPWVELPARVYNFYKKLLKLQADDEGEYLQIKNYLELSKKTETRWQIIDKYIDMLIDAGVVYVDKIDDNGANDYGQIRIYVAKEVA